MLAFAAPAALIALGFLVVPIALHLWSRRRGRPQLVGSIGFFAAAPPPATRHPRVDDLWLLLLRCGVLTALAFALADPFWRTSRPAAGANWALVDSAVAADPRHEPLLDSLRTAGAEIHVLGTGPIWSLLREADFEAPGGTRFLVVAPNRGASGELPVLRAETQWLVPPPGPLPLSPSPQMRRGGTPIPVHVYSDASRREDARYVTAAIRAAAEATGQPGAITQRDVAAPVGDAAWIVWLAAQPVPEAILERVRAGATLLSDAGAADPRAEPGRLRLTAASAPDAAGPVLRRRSAVQSGAPALWTDDAGKPVLTVQREGTGRWLTFHARFHPTWSDLPLHPAFPEAMTALWAGDAVRAPGAIDRPVAASQLLPVRQHSDRAATADSRVELYHAFWLIAVLLFSLERLLARRSREVAA